MVNIKVNKQNETNKVIITKLRRPKLRMTLNLILLFNFNII